MADAAQIQQLLSNLQSQVATIQSMAGQMAYQNNPTNTNLTNTNNPAQIPTNTNLTNTSPASTVPSVTAQVPTAPVNNVPVNNVFAPPNVPVISQPAPTNLGVLPIPGVSDVSALIRSMVNAELENYKLANPPMRTIQDDKLALPNSNNPAPTAAITQEIPQISTPQLAQPQNQPISALPAPETPQQQEAIVTQPTQPILTPTQSGGSMWDTLKPIIGAAFSREQQLWISNPANLMGFPAFLSTPEGKAVLVAALKAYQVSLGVKV